MGLIFLQFIYICVLFCSVPIQAAQAIVVDIEDIESSLVPEDSMSHAIAQLIFNNSESVEYELLVQVLATENVEKTQMGLCFHIRGEDEDKALKAGRIIARLLVNVHREKTELQKYADAQNVTIEEHFEQTKSAERKSFWSILSAVGSAALAVASTTWGAIEATGTAPLVVSVLCNCTNTSI